MVDLAKIKTLAQFIKEVAKSYDTKTAFRYRPRFRAQYYSYREVFQLSQAVAKKLRDRGIRKGDNILIWAANSPFWVAGFFGIQLAGATAVPLNVQSQEEFTRKIVKLTQAKFILKSKFLPKIAALNSLDLETLTPQLNLKLPEARENDLAEIVYTSGTTGFPKGVMLTHKNILANIRSCTAVIEISPNDRALSILPLSHMFEQIADLFLPMAAGAQVTYPGAVNSINISKNLVEDKITKMAAVPEFLRLVIRKIEETPAGFLITLGGKIPSMAARRLISWPIISQFGGALTTIVSGGAPLDPEVAKKWEALGMYVLQGYGTTEASPVISANSYRDRNISSVGKPLPGVQVKIATDGEILVKGENVTSGYYGNLQKTKEAFAKGGWYKTGDLGYIDSDGHLFVRGRKKYMIVTEAGENVYPEDIEFELSKFGQIKDSCVVGLTRAGKTIIHAVLLAPKLKKPQEIIQKVNSRLASHQQIQDYSIWPFDDFPRTVTKKVKRDEVIDYLFKRKIKADQLQTKTAGIVQKCLSQITNLPISQITLTKKLVADLKMDSLERVELVANIEEISGITLDEAEIGEITTVGDIVRRVKAQAGKTEKHKFRTWPLSPSVLFLRKILQYLILIPVVNYFLKREVKGLENLTNLKLPVVFCANHTSTIDPVAVVTSLPTKIREKLAIAAASDAIYETKKYQKYKNLLILIFNIFPFARVGQIKSSLEYTARLLDRGFSILVFPEGKVSESGKLQKFKSGVGYLAVELAVPIVPVKIEGTRKVVPPGVEFPAWPKKGRVQIVFGKPLIFPTESSYIEATEKIEKAISSLLTI